MDPVTIPFLESVPEASRQSVQTLVGNLGATTEDLASFKTFDEFATGFKPKAPPTAAMTSWKKALPPDLANSTTIQKFDDTVEGLGKQIESYSQLEKLLGHEKVPIPKDEKDVEGWNRFAKAMGVPDKPEGYGLQEVKLPDGVKGIAFDNKAFSEAVHKFNLSPTQAKGLHKAYTDMIIASYNRIVQERQQQLDTIVNDLRVEWGDSYDANIDLGQTVINKFSEKQEDADYLTSILTKDPKAIKFLTKIGKQFAENKIGEFAYKGYAQSPADAQAEYDSIMADPNHPYTNSKASKEAHDAAVAHVNKLLSIIAKAKQGQA